MLSDRRIKELKNKLGALQIRCRSKKFIINAAEGYFLIDASVQPISNTPFKNIIDGYEIHDLSGYSINRINISDCVKEIVIIAVKPTEKRHSDDE